MYFQSLEPTFQLFSITVIQCFRKIPSTQNPTGSVKKQVGLQKLFEVLLKQWNTASLVLN